MLGVHHEWGRNRSLRSNHILIPRMNEKIQELLKLLLGRYSDPATNVKRLTRPDEEKSHVGVRCKGLPDSIPYLPYSSLWICSGSRDRMAVASLSCALGNGRTLELQVLRDDE